MLSIPAKQARFVARCCCLPLAQCCMQGRAAGHAQTTCHCVHRLAPGSGSPGHAYPSLGNEKPDLSHPVRIYCQRSCLRHNINKNDPSFNVSIAISDAEIRDENRRRNQDNLLIIILQPYPSQACNAVPTRRPKKKKAVSKNMRL